MPSVATYSAGTAFLTVVPSFLGVEQAMSSELKKMGKDVENTVKESLPKGMAEGAKRAGVEGDRAGKDYSGAFNRAAKKDLTEAFKSIAIPEPGVKLSKWDKAMLKVRKDIRELSQESIGTTIDEKTAFKAIDNLRGRLQGLRDTAPIGKDTGFFNARAADTALGHLTAIGEDARRRGAQVGEEYAGAFNTRVQRITSDVAKAIPVLKPEFDASDARKKLEQLRQDAEKLSKRTIGVDISADDAFKEIKRLEEEFKTLDHQHIDVDVRTNARTAAAGMTKLIDENEVRRSAEQLQKDISEHFASGFTNRIGKVLEDGIKQIPAIPLNADPSPAEEKLAQLRQDMKELSGKTIGINISAADAYAEIKRIESELKALDNRHVDVEVRVNARGAAAGISKFIDENEMRKSAEQVAKDVAEAFQSRFSSRLSQTLAGGKQAIPSVQMTLENSDAERKLAALRVRMDDLSNKTIGVNIDGAGALAELKLIEAGLKSLDRKRVDVNVRTNAREAASGITKFISEVEKSGSALDQMGNSAGLSMSRLGVLIALGASFGSVLVPAVLAGAAAIGTLGTMAAAGASGIGVFALGISGVSDAVKAMDQYQGDAAKSSNSLNQAQRRMAGTSDAVQQAESSLANTRENIANAAVDAARRVTDAERAVGDARHSAELAAQQSAGNVESAQRTLTGAEQDARDARLALNDAYKEATRQLRDLQSQVKHNAIDQEQATIAIAKAKQDLDKLMANSRATDLEKRDAKAAYDERVLQLEDLQNRGQDLAAQQSDANKKGVEGSDLVVAAQKRVADADDKATQAQKALERARADQVEQARQSARQISDAQQAVADAQRAQEQQARQGAYQIEQAEQAIINAKRQEAQAWEKTGIAGGDALSKLNWQMAQLSPAAQRFAKFIFGLKDEAINLRNAASENLLPGLQEAITMILPYMPAVAQFIGNVAAQLGSMAVQASKALGSPVWTRFFSYVNATVVPSLQQMFDIGRNVAEGLVSLFMALTPFNRSVGNGLVQLSKDFATWADRLDHTAGFQDFLDYVKTNGPRVVELLGNTGQAFVHIVESAMPMGSFVLGILNMFMQLIDAIPTPVLTVIVSLIGAMTAGIVGLNLALKAGKLRDQLAEVFAPKWAAFQEGLTGMVDKYAISTGRATSETGKFRTALETAKGMGSSFKDNLGNIVGLLGEGGPWGIALVAATAGIEYLMNKSAQQEQQTVTLSTALGNLSEAYRSVGTTGGDAAAGMDKAFSSVVKGSPDLQKAVTTLNNLGISFEQMVRVANGGDPSQIIAAITREQERLDNEMRTPGNFFQIFDNEKRLDRINELEAMKNSFLENAKALGIQTDAMKLLNQAEGHNSELEQALRNYGPMTQDVRKNISDAFLDNAKQIDVLSKLVDAFGTTEGNAAAKADALRYAVEQQTGAAIKANDAEETLAGQMINLRDQVQQAKDAHDENATSLDMNSTTALRNRDALEQVAASIQKMYFEDIAANKPIQDVTAAHGQRIEALRKEAERLGLAKDATDDLIKKYGEVDGSITTVFDTPGFEKVYKDLQRLQFIQQMIKQGKSVDEAKALFEKGNSVDQLIANLIGRAAGGLIEGPWKGPTADNMLIRANPREFVHQVKAVDYYGVDFMHALNQQQIPKEILPGFARGGQVNNPNKTTPKPWVNYPFPVNVNDAFIPTEQQAIDAAGGVRRPSGGGGSSGAGGGPASSGQLGDWIRQAIGYAGVPDSWGAPMQVLVMRESGGNPNSINLWDSNAAAGMPSIGLAQVIGPTFASYRDPRLPNNLYDPVANLVASFNYIKSRYGSIFNVQQANPNLPPMGYAFGGLVDDLSRQLPALLFDDGGMLMPGLNTVLNATNKPEPVLNSTQWDMVAAVSQNAGRPAAGHTYNFNMRDTDLTASKLRAVQAEDAVRAREGRAR